MCVCVCVFGIYGVKEEKEVSYMEFVCMLSAELGQACVNFAWAARQPETEAPVHQWQPVYVETSVYIRHSCMYILLC